MRRILVESNGDWFCRSCGQGQNDGEGLEVDDVLECERCLGVSVVVATVDASKTKPLPPGTTFTVDYLTETTECDTE